MSKKIEQTNEKEYMYYICKGKYVEDDAGEKRHICKGHVFSLNSNLTRCPVCGELLGILRIKTEIKAITLAFDKCFFCNHRDKSAAVNDYHCVGGESPTEKVKGKPACNGCLCVKCCNELIENFNIGKKYGMNMAFAALMKLDAYARWYVKRGKKDDEAKRRQDEMRSGDQVLREIRDEVFQRWMIDAYNKTLKEAGKPEVAVGNLGKSLKKVMEQMNDAVA